MTFKEQVFLALIHGRSFHTEYISDSKRTEEVSAMGEELAITAGELAAAFCEVHNHNLVEVIPSSGNPSKKVCLRCGETEKIERG